MIRFIFFVAVLIFAVWLGLHIHSDPGYALFSYGHWSVELPLWLTVILLVLLIMVTHWILRISQFTGSVSGRVKHWSNKRKLRNAQYRTSQGLIDLSEGNWRRAEKNLVKAANDGDTPLINFLAAAKAAQEQDAYERRDNYLRKAHHINPEAKIAVELTQAELQIHHRQWEQALATLRHLRELAPKHNHVLKLLQSVYLELKDWRSVVEITPELRRLKIGTEAELTAIEEMAYEQILAEASQSNSAEFDVIWANLPKAYKNKSNFAARYCEHLIASKKNNEAEQLIRETLKKEWNKDLVLLYSTIPDVDRKKQLLTAEGWLKNNKHDPDLLLCLGRLCKSNQLWGKARTFFESSIEVHPGTAAYTELGQLFEHLNEIPMALDCYRKALALK
jgi:HemY protein